MTSLPVIVDHRRKEFGFSRTVCGCEECTINCEFMPGYLVPADVRRYMLATWDNEESAEKWAEKYLLASPGALVLYGGKQRRLGTLVPARKEDGSCVNLSGGRCLVHVAAPFGCAFFDAHMPESEYHARSQHGLKAIMDAWDNDEQYAKIWRYLESKGLTAPGPEDTRPRMKAEWERRRDERRNQRDDS
jgi:hypothetical protein